MGRFCVVAPQRHLHRRESVECDSRQGVKLCCCRTLGVCPFLHFPASDDQNAVHCRSTWCDDTMLPRLMEIRLQGRSNSSPYPYPLSLFVEPALASAEPRSFEGRPYAQGIALFNLHRLPMNDGTVQHAIPIQSETDDVRRAGWSAAC
jgi:hypothetical protein